MMKALEGECLWFGAQTHLTVPETGFRDVVRQLRMRDRMDAARRREWDSREPTRG